MALQRVSVGTNSVTFSYNTSGFSMPIDSETGVTWSATWDNLNLNEQVNYGTSTKTVYNDDENSVTWHWSFSGAYSGSSNSSTGEITAKGLLPNKGYEIKGELSASGTISTYTCTYYRHRYRENTTSSWINDVTKKLIKTVPKNTETGNYNSTSYTLSFETTAFKWAKDPEVGGSISEAITADKWNELGSCLGVPSNVSKGDTITATSYNEYADKLDGVSRVQEKTIITAKHFKALSDAVNKKGKT